MREKKYHSSEQQGIIYRMYQQKKNESAISYQSTKRSASCHAINVLLLEGNLHGFIYSKNWLHNRMKVRTWKKPIIDERKTKKKKTSRNMSRLTMIVLSFT